MEDTHGGGGGQPDDATQVCTGLPLFKNVLTKTYGHVDANLVRVFDGCVQLGVEAITAYNVVHVQLPMATHLVPSPC